MFCPTCHHQEDFGASTCSQCLAPLGSEVPRDQMVPAPATEAAAPPPAEAEPDNRERCAEHPDFPIAGTCHRCGRFVCVRCAPETATQSKVRCTACLEREAAARDDEDALGGWLLLLSVQVVLAPVLELGVGALALSNSHLGRGLGFGAMGLFDAFIAWSFFGRRRFAPRLLVGKLTLNALMNLYSLKYGSGFCGLVVSVLWIPYLLTSERVRRSFTH